MHSFIFTNCFSTAPASAPLEVSVSVLNSTSILAQWRPPEEQHQNGVIEHYIITIAQVMGNKTFLVDSNELVASSLHPSYSYWLSVAAVTVDTGPFSEAVPFTLPEDGTLYVYECKSLWYHIMCVLLFAIVFYIYLVPSGSPQNLKVTTLSSSMVGLLWEPPVTSDHNGNLTGYFITVMAEGDTAPNDVLVQASVLRYTLEGLKPFTNYSVTVAASTSVGIGPPSFLWIATLEDCECTTVSLQLCLCIPRFIRFLLVLCYSYTSFVVLVLFGLFCFLIICCFFWA